MTTIKKNNDKIKSVRLVYYKDSKLVKKYAFRRIQWKINHLLRTLQFKIYTKIKIVVKYTKGENVMILKNNEEALWALQCFIKEYQ